jgi:hypothetical protein
VGRPAGAARRDVSGGNVGIVTPIKTVGYLGFIQTVLVLVQPPTATKRMDEMNNELHLFQYMNVASSMDVLVL